MSFKCPRCGQPVAVFAGYLEQHWEPDPATAGCYPLAYPVTLQPIDGSEAPRSEVYPVCGLSGARVVWP